MKKNGKNNGNPFKDMPNVHLVKIDNKENHVENQDFYDAFWESMTENEYVETVRMINTNKFSSDSKLYENIGLLEFVKMKIKEQNEQVNKESKEFFDLLPQMHESVQKSMIEFINDHSSDEQTHLEYVSLVKMARERSVLEHKDFTEQARIKTEYELEKLGDLIEENLRNEELEEEETDRLEREFFAGYAQEDTIEEVETKVETEILTQNPTTETMKTQKEVASEVKKEVSKSEKTTKKEKVVKEKASNTTVNNTQSITNNTVNFNLEKPKPKMSIADKIIEAQKMLLIAERKQLTEDRLKAFHGYLHANREGDNFRLMSLDEKYNFSTNNPELVKEVNIVLERFLKNKIQEFETELANFQI